MNRIMYWASMVFAIFAFVCIAYICVADNDMVSVGGKVISVDDGNAVISGSLLSNDFLYELNDSSLSVGDHVNLYTTMNLDRFSLSAVEFNGVKYYIGLSLIMIGWVGSMVSCMIFAIREDRKKWSLKSILYIL